MEGEIYLVGVLEGCYKIGRSSDAARRLLHFSPKLPVTLTILHRVSTDDSPWLESIFHTAFKHRRTLGEWFRLSPQDIALFQSLVAIRRADRLPNELLELWQKNGGETATASPPKPTPAPADPPAAPANLAGDLIVVAIGKVHPDSEKYISPGEVYEVKSGIAPSYGDVVLIDFKGWYSLRDVTGVHGHHVRLNTYKGNSSHTVSLKDSSPDNPRIVGILNPLDI
jgi:hypothetical protein